MEQQNVTLEKNERPALLTTLCILTFIWSGLMSLFSLIGIFASGALSGYLENMLPGFGSMSAGFFIIIFLVMLILFGLSLFGAIKMFQLKKSGYVIYMIPNCLMLLFQIIGIAAAFTFLSLISLLVSILFIVLYGTNLKYMK